MHCPWHIVARSCGMCLIPRRKRRVNQMHLVEDVDDAPSSGAASSGAGPSCVSCPICKVQHGAVDKASPQVPGQPPSRVALVDGIDICCDITLGTHCHDVSPEEGREMETHRILLVVVGYPLSIDCLVSLFFVMYLEEMAGYVHYPATDQQKKTGIKFMEMRNSLEAFSVASLLQLPDHRTFRDWQAETVTLHVVGGPLGSSPIRCCVLAGSVSFI